MGRCDAAGESRTCRQTIRDPAISCHLCGLDGSARVAGRSRTWYTSQPSTSAISAGSAARHAAQGRVRHEATPTPAGCAMPTLRQRWLGLCQTEVVPGRPISLHGGAALQKIFTSPSQEPGLVWDLGRERRVEPAFLDGMPWSRAGGVNRSAANKLNLHTASRWPGRASGKAG